MDTYLPTFSFIFDDRTYGHFFSDGLVIIVNGLARVDNFRFALYVLMIFC